MVDTYDHLTGPECPCPAGLVCSGDWCNPDWYEGIDNVARGAGDMVGGVGGVAEAIEDGVGVVRGTVVDNFRDFFNWLGELLMNVPRLFADLGSWIVDQWPWDYRFYA